MATLPPELDGAPGPSAWLAGLAPSPPATALGPLQLAWLGDAVWELHQRLRRCRLPAKSQQLHQQVVEEVKAAAQARALERLEGVLTEDERDLVRRGRNRSGRGPRNGDPGAYGQATGFEALLGWLFLHDPPRLAELLDHLKENDP